MRVLVLSEPGIRCSDADISREIEFVAEVPGISMRDHHTGFDRCDFDLPSGSTRSALFWV